MGCIGEISSQFFFSSSFLGGGGGWGGGDLGGGRGGVISFSAVSTVAAADGACKVDSMGDLDTLGFSLLDCSSLVTDLGVKGNGILMEASTPHLGGGGGGGAFMRGTSWGGMLR